MVFCVGAIWRDQRHWRRHRLRILPELRQRPQTLRRDQQRPSLCNHSGARFLHNFVHPWDSLILRPAKRTLVALPARPTKKLPTSYLVCLILGGNTSTRWNYHKMRHRSWMRRVILSYFATVLAAVGVARAADLPARVEFNRDI